MGRFLFLVFFSLHISRFLSLSAHLSLLASSLVVGLSPLVNPGQFQKVKCDPLSIRRLWLSKDQTIL